LPVGKLVATPPRLLLEVLSSLCSFANTDSSAAGGFAGVAGAGDGDGPGDTAVRTVLRTTARCFGGFAGLATGFGACTVMLGREVLPEGSVSAIAAPLRLNGIIAVDAMAIARFEKKRDENFIVMCLEVAARAAFLARPIRHRHGLLQKKKRSITGSVRCISRMSACGRFEIFHVGPAGRYIMLQNRISLASPVEYSGVYGKFGPHSCRRR
jgi:hypothetical protein